MTARGDGMRRASTYPNPEPKLSAQCGNCGKVWGIHGAHDGRCPSEETRYGFVGEQSETFWTASPPPKVNGEGA